MRPVEVPSSGLALLMLQTVSTNSRHTIVASLAFHILMAFRANLYALTVGESIFLHFTKVND